MYLDSVRVILILAMKEKLVNFIFRILIWSSFYPSYCFGLTILPLNRRLVTPSCSNSLIIKSFFHDINSCACVSLVCCKRQSMYSLNASTWPASHRSYWLQLNLSQACDFSSFFYKWDKACSVWPTLRYRDNRMYALVKI